MKTVWTSNLKDQSEIDRAKQSIKNSKFALDRQTQIINSWIDEINSVELNPAIYDKQSWSALQAHYNGEKRAYNKILRLIDLNQEE
jgi:hypothetical protein